MRTIICKKCGTPIDADLGECPICGSVYYVLPREDSDETRVWDDTAAKIHSAIEKEERAENADEDDLTKVIPAAAVMKDEPTPKAAPKNPQRMERKPAARTWMFAALAAAMLAILVVVMCFMTGVFDFGANMIEMPDLLGLERNVAVNQLKALDISPNLVYEESDAPEGSIIRQKPNAGDKITKRTGITLTVSSGTGEKSEEEVKLVEVPEVLDKSYDEAVSALQALGLHVVKGGEEYSPITEEGKVMRQSPLSGSKLSPGESVTLTVSKGPEEKEFNVVITAGKGGSASPAGTVTVKEGESLAVAFIPDEGYELTDVRIDGGSIGALSEFTIDNMDADHSVYGVFAAVKTEPEPPAESEKPGLPASPTDLR